MTQHSGDRSSDRTGDGGPPRGLVIVLVALIAVEIVAAVLVVLLLTAH